MEFYLDQKQAQRFYRLKNYQIIPQTCDRFSTLLFLTLIKMQYLFHQRNVGRFCWYFYKIYLPAWNATDISVYLELNPEDYEITLHSTGEVKKLEEFGWDA